jgi:hypothetical protein
LDSHPVRMDTEAVKASRHRRKGLKYEGAAMRFEGEGSEERAFSGIRKGLLPISRRLSCDLE